MSIMKKLVPSTIAASLVMLSTSAFAQGMAKAGSNESDVKMWAAAGAGFAIGLGGTMGQGRAASAALEGISRNPGAAPRIMTPMILGLALIESLVLFALVIAYFLQGKV